jgi:hypothetical protein
MSGGCTAGKAESKGVGASLPLAALMLVITAFSAFAPRPAEALPSYARQTGQQCAACHNGFPELTPYGRLFKLNGYTFTGGTLNVPPIAAMAIGDFTHTRADQVGGAAPGFGVNDNFAFTGSLFYGGKIADHLGAFIQGTYDQVGNFFHWDNTDIRYANVASPAGTELVYGVSLNNNPTVEDVWNTTPAWGYPYISSELAPTPAAKTLIESTFAQQVVGVTPYIYWNRLVYAEIGAYKTLGPWTLFALGIEPSGTSAIGAAPTWRLAVEPQWGNNTWEVGTFGMTAPLVPMRTTGFGDDHLTDVGFDTQYEWLGADHSFSVQARYILENQSLGASQPLGFSTNGIDHLRTYQLKGTYWYKQTVGFTTAYFGINGTSDAGLYSAVSPNNSPNSNGWIFELDYVPFNYGGPNFWPWLNAKFGLQFVHYDKFDGTSSGASANDTLFAFAWFAF